MRLAFLESEPSSQRRKSIIWPSAGATNIQGSTSLRKKNTVGFETVKLFPTHLSHRWKVAKFVFEALALVPNRLSFLGGVRSGLPLVSCFMAKQMLKANL